MYEFKYQLGDNVRLKTSNEEGVITGLATYSNSDDSYLILYKAGDGRQCEIWWSQSQIERI